MRKGFQLIEVIIATAVFFLIALFLLNLLPTSQWAVAMAEHRLTAQNLASSKLEELRVGPFGNLAEGAHPPTEAEHDGVRFVTSYEVRRVPDADFDLVREVDVTVTWEVRGRTRQVRTRSYVSKVR